MAIEKERIYSLYQTFQALPTDPLEIIKQKFIRKKRLIGSRRYYMPNVASFIIKKKEYLLQLDARLK